MYAKMTRGLKGRANYSSYRVSGTL